MWGHRKIIAVGSYGAMLLWIITRNQHINIFASINFTDI